MKIEVLALSWIIIIPLVLAGLALLASRKIAAGARPKVVVMGATSAPQTAESHHADAERLLTEAIELSKGRGRLRSP